MLGAQIGLLVGAVAIANHLIEAFVLARPFVLIISPVLLALALLGMAGAAAWERTGSVTLAVIGGVCCAIVATLITLCSAVAGHSSITISSRYVHPSEDAVLAAMARLGGHKIGHSEMGLRSRLNRGF